VYANIGIWPFFTIKHGLNVAEPNFRFAFESGYFLADERC
jgi:hypothetical protein